jgi:TetR/AcrR family transcriptional regulator, regulator of cefoperazone and chloramphenicol sensitivity
MAAPAKKARPITARTSRLDGAATRSQILQTAGEIFAERGYAETTSKEICHRADANLASVNYHFGSKDGLYEAVLIEAHRQIISLEELRSIVEHHDDPRLSLRLVLMHFVELAGQPEASWGLRVVLREMMSPSPLAPALVQRAMLPKMKLVLGLVSSIMKLPEDHSSVQVGLAMVMIPCACLVIIPKTVKYRAFPALHRSPAETVDDMMRYALAGLDALSHQGKCSSVAAVTARKSRHTSKSR